MYELFDHTADLGLRVTAADRNELFAEAARGLLAVLVDDPATVQPRTEVTFEVDGTQVDYLLFDWLSELLFRFDTEGMLFSEFELDIHDRGLNAIARGESADAERHQLAHEVKAITYHQLEVRETNDGWSAQLIVDI